MSDKTPIYYQSQRVDNSLVLNSSINHHLLSQTRHHSANTRHIVQTNQRLVRLLGQCEEHVGKIEKTLSDTSLDLASHCETLSLCTTVCKTAMMKTKVIINDTVTKERSKAKCEKELSSQVR